MITYTHSMENEGSGKCINKYISRLDVWEPVALNAFEIQNLQEK